MMRSVLGHFSHIAPLPWSDPFGGDVSGGGACRVVPGSVHLFRITPPTASCPCALGRHRLLFDKVGNDTFQPAHDVRDGLRVVEQEPRERICAEAVVIETRSVNAACDVHLRRSVRSEDGTRTGCPGAVSESRRP